MIVKELDLIGKTLSNYKIDGRLGRGGMATVYKAHELSLNRMVALKVLSPQLSEDTEYIKRFQREAQAAAQLNHPNIVQIYSIGDEKGIHYFAMELIKGRSLAELKKEMGVLEPAKAVAIIKQVADALTDAHRVGLVHRDIKPSNIMMDSLGRAKVTDFGIAYVSTAQTKLTREGSVIGTPEYLSPEQCEGKTVDQRSDIYSLGVTLYELLSGKTPYEADTPVSMLMKIVKGSFPPLCDVNTNISKPLCLVVEKMMATSPSARYQTMQDVIKDFNALDMKEAPVVAVNTKKEESEVKPEPFTHVVNEEIPEAVPAAVAANTDQGGNKRAALIIAAVIVLLMGGAFAAKMLLNKDNSDGEKPPVVVAQNQDDPAKPTTEQESPSKTPSETQTETPQPDENKDTPVGDTVSGEPNTVAQTEDSKEVVDNSGNSEPANDSATTNLEAGIKMKTGTVNETDSGTFTHGNTTTVQAQTPSVTNTGQVQASPQGVSGTVANNSSAANKKANQWQSPPTTIQKPAGVGGPVKKGGSGNFNTGQVKPAQSRPAKNNWTPAALPPANTYLVTAIGDSDKADVVGAYMEEILGRKNYKIIDRPSIQEDKIPTVTRNHVIITAKQLGTTTLEYYGNSTEQYSVSLSIKVVSPQKGTIVKGPRSRVVKYTALNAEENLRESVEKLMAALNL